MAISMPFFLLWFLSLIVFNPNKLINIVVLVRYLDEKYPNLFRATDEELKLNLQMVPMEQRQNLQMDTLMIMVLRVMDLIQQYNGILMKKRVVKMLMETMNVLLKLDLAMNYYTLIICKKEKQILRHLEN